MFKNILALFVVATLLIPAGSGLAAGTEEETVVCPVCGYVMAESDASIQEYEGKTYYFCDAGCKAWFLQNPDAMTSGTTLDPVCGMSFKKTEGVSARHGGRELYFCSPDCRGRYLSDPGRYEQNYDPVAKEVRQVREMKHETLFEGHKIYFISKENKEKFEKDPDAYVWAECKVGGDVFLRKDAAAKREYKGKMYYFGCMGCLKAFEEDPERYAKGRASSSQGKCKLKRENVKCPHKQGKTVDKGYSGDCPYKDKGSDKGCKKSCL